MTLLPVASRAKVLLCVVAGVVVVALFWTKFAAGPTAVEASNKDRNATNTVAQRGSDEQAQFVDLSEKQAGAVKVGTVGARDFALWKPAVGTIDFNETMLVQIFSQYPGKILQAVYHLGG